MRIEVVFSPRARVVECVELVLAAGATLGLALEASGLLAQVPEPERARLAFSVWGERARADRVLRDRDRVEICRPLSIDPMEARRLRARTDRMQRRKPRG